MSELLTVSKTKILKSGETLDVEEWTCPSCGVPNTTICINNEIVYGGRWSNFYLGKRVDGCFKGSCYTDNQLFKVGEL